MDSRFLLSLELVILILISGFIFADNTTPGKINIRDGSSGNSFEDTEIYTNGPAFNIENNSNNNSFKHTIIKPAESNTSQTHISNSTFYVDSNHTENNYSSEELSWLETYVLQPIVGWIVLTLFLTLCGYLIFRRNRSKHPRDIV